MHTITTSHIARVAGAVLLASSWACGNGDGPVGHAGNTEVSGLPTRGPRSAVIVAPQPVSNQFVVNTTVSGYQFSPAIAMRDAGDFVIVWSSERPDGNEAVFLQRFDAAGARVGGEVRVDDPSFQPFFNSRKRDPAVAMDDAGNVFVVWAGGLISLGDQFSYTFSVAQIYGQRFDAAGLRQGGNFIVNTASAGPHETPSVGMYASGEAVVAWSSADGSGTGIFMKRFDPAGMEQGARSCLNYLGASAVCDVRVNTFTTQNQGNPKVAVPPGPCLVPPTGGVCQLGDFMIVWEGAGSTDPAGIFAQLFNGGNALPSGVEFRVNTGPAYGNPAVGIDDNVNVVVAWIGDAGSGPGIVAQRYGQPSGPCPTSCASSWGPLGGEFLVGSLVGGPPHFTRLSVGRASTGSFVVAWNDLQAGTANDAIYGRAYDGGGNALGDFFQVSAAPSTYYRPAVRMSAAGNLVATWEGGNDGGFFGIWARRFAGGSDSTPPVITPSVSGTPGANGWYTSDVTVTWAVNDPESAIASQAGCGPVSVTSDTAGVTFTCTATSGGGTASQSVTIRRDVTPPSANLAVTSGTSGSNGWHVSDVTVSTSGADSISGPVTCTAPQVLTTETAGQTFSGSCTNEAGLSANASPLMVKVDKTAPAISILAPMDGARYALNQVVAASYTCTDAPSGVASCIGSVPPGSNIDTASAGTKSFTVIATDAAGNIGTRSATYTVGCRYLTIAASPSTVRQGGWVTLTTTLTSCANTAESIAIAFTLNTPANAPGCWAPGTVSFTTPSFFLLPGTQRSLPLPLPFPSWLCPGVYSLTASALRAGQVVDSSTVAITVVPR